ncbi:hypothetical protein [Nonomuraea sp. NPDC049784]|uniref:hypothetical protein n=1 Tax=Nonomuraea sp. NPDC049784 TaxID=3154361 RepID=UPI0033F1B6D6
MIRGQQEDDRHRGQVRSLQFGALCAEFFQHGEPMSQVGAAGLAEIMSILIMS